MLREQKVSSSKNLPMGFETLPPYFTVRVPNHSTKLVVITSDLLVYERLLKALAVYKGVL
jgi:hypothetical protein